MNKTALIWLEPIYKAKANDELRCNNCKAKLFDFKTNTNLTNMLDPGKLNEQTEAYKDFMFCPDCNNVVGRVAEYDE